MSKKDDALGLSLKYTQASSCENPQKEIRNKISLVHKGKEITKEHREKCSIAMKNTILINNGIKSIRHKKDQPIPEGWVRGRLTKRSKSLINNSSK